MFTKQTSPENIPTKDVSKSLTKHQKRVATLETIESKMFEVIFGFMFTSILLLASCIIIGYAVLVGDLSEEGGVFLTKTAIIGAACSIIAGNVLIFFRKQILKMKYYSSWVIYSLANRNNNQTDIPQ